MKKEILAVIPARGGSKGIPGKNMKLLAGKPLIRYTIEAANHSRLITRAVLSSDDEAIIRYCKTQGLEAPFKRPKYLSGDNALMADVIMHAVRFLEKEENYIPDYIVLLQPTSPLRRGGQIDEAIKLLMGSGADSVVSVTELPHNFNPDSVMKIYKGRIRPLFASKKPVYLRQKKPRLYARNGPAILALTRDCLINKKSLYGDKTIPYLMKKEDSVDIDDVFDFRIAEYLITG